MTPMQKVGNYARTALRIDQSNHDAAILTS
jgi:hypothetical protein